MKMLGIDFGTKRVGLALSDEGGRIAFPLCVLPNDERLVGAVTELVNKEQAGAVIVGDTRTAGGAQNEATGACERFVKTLCAALSVPVYIVPEHGTTGAARASHTEGMSRGKTASPRARDGEGVDARAAALILQRHLDATRP